MRLLSLAVVTAAAVSMAIAASAPANAIQRCTCNSILGSGFCTDWTCSSAPIDMSVPTLKPVHSARECRKSQVLMCDYSACKVVCDPSKK